MCKYNIDWGSVPAWLGLVFTVFGSYIVWKNYNGEKKKRRLSLRPLFTISDTVVDIQDKRHELHLENIGEIAILRKIINEANPQEHISVPKLSYSKGSILKLVTLLKSSVSGVRIIYSADYNHSIYFEDIEGRIYMQNVRFIDNKHYETIPVVVKSLPA